MDASDVQAGEVENLRRQVEYLKTALAFEARVIEAQTFDLKSLAKGRRKVLEKSVEAMRYVALGGISHRYFEKGSSNELDNLRKGYRA